MRLLLALLIAISAGIVPAEARRGRDGFGRAGYCRCDAYLSPHHRGAGRAGYAWPGYRRY